MGRIFLDQTMLAVAVPCEVCNKQHGRGWRALLSFHTARACGHVLRPWHCTWQLRAATDELREWNLVEKGRIPSQSSWLAWLPPTSSVAGTPWDTKRQPRVRVSAHAKAWLELERRCASSPEAEVMCMVRFNVLFLI